MTEQMTGRTGPGVHDDPEGPGGTPGSPAPPGRAVPSPRDLATRTPHREGARAADHARPAEPPAPAAAPQAPAPAPAGAEPPRPQATSPGQTRATGAQALVYALERVGADVVFGIP